MKEENNWLQKKFMAGHFVIKYKEMKFNSVSPVMKFRADYTRGYKGR